MTEIRAVVTPTLQRVLSKTTSTKRFGYAVRGTPRQRQIFHAIRRFDFESHALPDSRGLRVQFLSGVVINEVALIAVSVRGHVCDALSDAIVVDVVFNYGIVP